MKKKGTHSTQKKYFGTIPRSEFYGFVLGYALGLILSGALRLESQFQTLLCALAGLGIGYYIDKKYFQEPDEEAQSPGSVQDIPEAPGPVQDIPEAPGPVQDIPEAPGSAQDIPEAPVRAGSGTKEAGPEMEGTGKEAEKPGRGQM